MTDFDHEWTIENISRKGAKLAEKIQNVGAPSNFFWIRTMNAYSGTLCE